MASTAGHSDAPPQPFATRPIQRMELRKLGTGRCSHHNATRLLTPPVLRISSFMHYRPPPTSSPGALPPPSPRNVSVNVSVFGDNDFHRRGRQLNPSPPAFTTPAVFLIPHATPCALGFVSDPAPLKFTPPRLPQACVSRLPKTLQRDGERAVLRQPLDRRVDGADKLFCDDSLCIPQRSATPQAPV